MALQVGSRLGHYDVTDLIGEGGMGQVYQATDTKLNRQVALKILPEAFASDPDRLARFQREAQVLASLNHPGIAAIYGLEEEGDTRALVLELVEGPTLADRIAQGPIPVDEALPIAKQIAEALEAAHEAGVIHRDLKPANIKVRDDGTVKVLDFGLAKALDTTPEGDPSLSPTLTAAATQMGVIMGTAAYMSPEQARGKPVDKRADIWAFGAVLFEMLTGKRSFEGEDVSLTLSAVLQREADWNALPEDVPPTLQTYLRRCLEKDPRQRVHDIADVRLAMDGAFETPVAAAPAPGAEPTLRLWQRPIPASTIVLVVAVVTGLSVWGVTRPDPMRVAHLSIPAPTAGMPDNRRAVAVSPDGTEIAYAAEGVLYRRVLDREQAVPIVSEEVSNPFYSPDGQWIGFYSEGARQLKRTSLADGTTITLTDVFIPQGVSWGVDDTVLFASDGIWSLPGQGGEPEVLIEAGEGEGLAHPSHLPSGEVVLFTSRQADGESQIVTQSLVTGERRVLVENGTNAHYVPTGHLLFVREAALHAVPFDLAQLEVSGSATPLVEDVAILGGTAQFSVSLNGVLVYVPNDAVSDQQRFVWVDRTGVETPTSVPAGLYGTFDLSPDGTSVAARTVDPTTGNFDIHVLDLERGNSSRLTRSPLLDSFPLWTTSGDAVVFQSNAGGTALVRQEADGTGTAERLLELAPGSGTENLSENPLIFPYGWSGDGSSLVFGIRDDVFVLGPEGQVPLLAEPYREAAAAVSPDGKWLTYESDESGQFEVYVRSFPDVETSRSTISVAGGQEPVWSTDGSELFFRSLGGETFYAVPINTGAEFDYGTPAVLFRGQYAAAGGFMRRYDVAPDGSRFLVLAAQQVTGSAAGSRHMNIVLNWFEELKERVPVP
jgi:serine/threonine-protein kinase